MTFLLVVSLLVLAGVLPAQASLWVEFEPSQAPWDTEVVAATIGQDAATGALAILSPNDVVVLFLGAEDDAIDGPDDPGAIEIGELEIDQEGHGRLAFRVPDIRPGSYVAYLHCQDCSFDSAGLTFAEAGSFEVVQANLPATGFMLMEVLAAAAALILIGLVVAATSKRTELHEG